MGSDRLSRPWFLNTSLQEHSNTVNHNRNTSSPPPGALGIPFSLSLTLFLFVVVQAGAARLHQQTLKAFEDYVGRKEVRMAERLEGRQSFLWAGESAERRQGLKQGRTSVQPWNGKGELDVPRGLIHDWVGAAFIPGATLDQALAIVQDYDRHHSFYRAEVLESKLLDRTGDQYDIYLRLRKHKIVTVVLNTKHAVHYSPLDGNRAYSRSYSTRIAEVQYPGKPSERELPAGKDRGFLWRINSYWRFQQTPAGVYIECEIVALTRGVPFGLGWLIKPIIRSLPKRSVIKTLEDTRAAILTGCGVSETADQADGSALPDPARARCPSRWSDAHTCCTRRREPL